MEPPIKRTPVVRKRVYMRGVVNCRCGANVQLQDLGEHLKRCPAET